MLQKTKTIALFLDASNVGGIEQHVATLATSLSRQPNVKPVIILWRYYGPTPLISRFRLTGVPILFTHGSVKELRKLLKVKGVDILHTHGYKANLIGRWLRLTKRIRVISTHHNGDLGEGRVKVYTWLDAMTAPISENWVVSKEIQKRLRTHSTLMPNYIPMMSTDIVSGGDVVFVGRFQQEKRPDRFASLAELCPRLSFSAFGDGPLLSTISSRNLKNLSLKGFEKDAELIWKDASVLVICSDHEGLPLVALEAMSRGVPVIAWPVGRLPELIEHECNGWIVSSEQECCDVLTQWQSLSTVQKQRIQKAAQLTIARSYSEQACIPDYVYRYLNRTTPVVKEAV